MNIRHPASELPRIPIPRTWVNSFLAGRPLALREARQPLLALAVYLCKAPAGVDPLTLMVRRHRPHSRIRRRLPPGLQSSGGPLHGGEPCPPLVSTGGGHQRYPSFEVPAVVDLTAQKRHRLEVSVAADTPTRSAVVGAERLGKSPRVAALFEEAGAGDVDAPSRRGQVEDGVARVGPPVPPRSARPGIQRRQVQPLLAGNPFELSARIDASAILRGWKQYLHVVVRGGGPPRAQLACGPIHRR